MRRRMPSALHVTTVQRVIGLKDAVEELGTHEVCGHMVPWTCQQVRLVLQGKHISARLMRVMLEKKPELFTLPYVADSVKQWAKNNGWRGVIWVKYS